MCWPSGMDFVSLDAFHYLSVPFPSGHLGFAGGLCSEGFGQLQKKRGINKIDLQCNAADHSSNFH